MRSMTTLHPLAAAAAALTLTLTACGGNDAAAPDAPAPEAAETSGADEVDFDPAIEMRTEDDIVTGEDGKGMQINLAVPLPVAEVTGVDPDIAEAFAEAVGEAESAISEQLGRYSDLEVYECGGGMVEDDQAACDAEALVTVKNSGIYEDYGTVASLSSFAMSSRDRNHQVHSVTMNLRTGELAELADFLDLSDGQARISATRALSAAEAWPYCGDETPEGYLESAAGFSPGDDGLLLMWETVPTSPATCQVEEVLVPWSTAEADGAGADGESDEAAADAASINGRWCPSESTIDPADPLTGCVTIDFPTATYDDGTAIDITGPEQPADQALYGQLEAPFGVYYAPGTPIEPAILEMYDDLTDVPNAERIFESQSGALLFKE